MIFTKGSTVTSAPASEPITTAEAKLWLKVDVDADDALIGALITAAREYIEARTGLALFTQTVVEYLDTWPAEETVSNPNREFHLMRYPVQSISSVKYYDDDNALQTLSTDVYDVDTSGTFTRIALSGGQSFPSLRNRINAVEVTYIAGWSATGSIPEVLKTALKLMLTHFYERRADSVSQMKTVADKLIESYYVPVI